MYKAFRSRNQKCEQNVQENTEVTPTQVDRVVGNLEKLEDDVENKLLQMQPVLTGLDKIRKRLLKHTPKAEEELKECEKSRAALQVPVFQRRFQTTADIISERAKARIELEFLKAEAKEFQVKKINTLFTIIVDNTAPCISERLASDMALEAACKGYDRFDSSTTMIEYEVRLTDSGGHSKTLFNHVWRTVRHHRLDCSVLPPWTISEIKSSLQRGLLRYGEFSALFTAMVLSEDGREDGCQFELQLIYREKGPVICGLSRQGVLSLRPSAI